MREITGAGAGPGAAKERTRSARRGARGGRRPGARPARPAGSRSRVGLPALLLVALLLPLLAGGAAAQATPPGVTEVSVAAPPRTIDDFEYVPGWTAHPASGVEMKLSADRGAHGRALRIDFRFRGGGYAIARKDLNLDLPENYAFTFLLRGRAPANHIEFKLVDPSNENVWWHVRRDVAFPEEWTPFTIKKRQISFAWGPIGGGEIRRVAAIEIVVTAGNGGEGTVWIDDLQLRPLPPPGAALPAPQAAGTTSAADHEAAMAADGDTLTWWSPARDDRAPALTLDFGLLREYGGLIVDWAPGRHWTDYDVEISDDGRRWSLRREVRGSNGGRDPLLMPESESRFVRLRARPGPTPAGRPREAQLREVFTQSLDWGATPEAFYQNLAREAPRGLYPRAILGEQAWWTVVGPLDGDPAEALLETDGRLEVGKASWSIEPFLYAEGRLLTWNELSFRPGWDDELGAPETAGRAADLALRVTAFAIPRNDSGTIRALGGESGRGHVLARYLVRNDGPSGRDVTLYLALRPFQVNPPAQFLNTPGGTAPIRSVARQGRSVRVNGISGVLSLVEPSAFGARSFDEGDLVAEHLRFGELLASDRLQGVTDRGSAAFAYRYKLAAGEEREVALLVPLDGPPPAGARAPDADTLAEAIAAARKAQAARRQELRDRIVLDAAGAGHETIETVWAQLAWILTNRDGAAIQPGARSYERSWIRDGALTSSALLRLGQDRIVRDFLLWFAGFQYEDGKVPCCVDHRGADPVPEHDSHGELIFLAAEYHRFTGDEETARRVWPAVRRAAAYIDTLRAQRRTPEWREPGREHFYGLLPPSISHEGYSAKPMHSYWDDLWALRGLKDAVYLAEALDFAGDAAALDASRREFEADLRASIAAALRLHGIDFIPGAADLGDFDATSTTIALTPVAATGILPEGALERTFERYWEFFRERRDGKPWDAFTPYETRSIGSFVRLGWRDRANEALTYFLRHRQPPVWRQWPEVVWSDSVTQRFIGDLPHSWCGSDFVRSALDMLAYTDEEAGTLVLAAGAPADWLAGEPGIRVENLPTTLGRLSYSAGLRGDTVEMRVESGVRVPPGGIILDPPLTGTEGTAGIEGTTGKPAGDRRSPDRPAATVNGRPAGSADVDAKGRIVLRELPAVVEYRVVR